MSLTPGGRIGPYEILSPLGAGGMGEVYRARDVRLNRDVAIKLLPEVFAQDAERVARFQREAQVLASLNHPNIAHIYGVEEGALVLELVDGPTLADRIAQGPLPIDDAVAIARQIADALEAAHDNGIVHRDLKPANIKLTQDGTVKVLDFGLAKAMDSAGAGRDTGRHDVFSMSPTLTSPAMHTHAGIILGTAVYMSPEQAKGRPADKRSDVWAFGCVLYEMLTGKRAFDGEDLTDVVAAVVRADPDWNALPPAVPSHLRTLLKGCLEKDRKARIGDIAVARFLLEQGAMLPAARTAPAEPVRTRSRAPIVWASALIALAAIAGLIAVWRPWVPPVDTKPLRVSVDVGADVSLLDVGGPAAVLSPDGSTLAFVGGRANGVNLALFVRRLDQLQATPLSGTEGAFGPFFSPDGQWIGFFAGGKLKKISVAGGAAVTLCDALNGRGGSWGDDDVIVFSPNSTAGTSLQRVSAGGGTPEKIADLAAGEVTQRYPQVLPGAKALIYSTTDTLGNFSQGSIVAWQLPNGPRKVLIKEGFFARYVPSGHILFYRDKTVFAAPFDVERLEVTGAAVPVIEGARSNGNTGGAQFDVSRSGMLVYTAGTIASDNSPMRWLDRSGQMSTLRGAPSNWTNPAVSPDGRFVAVDIYDGTQTDIWVYDWERDTLSRRTFSPRDDVRPVWSPDGTRIAYASRRDDAAVFNIYWQKADGTGDAERLTTSKNVQYPTSFHPNGRVLTFMESSQQSLSDVMMLPIEGDEKTGWKAGTPVAFLKAQYAESSAMFSPDGRWLAYLSNEGGRNDVFVQPYPGPGGKYQISTTAADDPTWSRSAPELFFLNTVDFRLMVMPYRVDGNTFIAGKPAALSDTRITTRPRTPSRDLDLHPDGKRFVVGGGEEGDQRLDKVVLVFNFLDELRRVAKK
jgi:serine/threonine-protein kinase